MSADLLEKLRRELPGSKDRVAAVEKALDLVLGWRRYFWIGVYRVDGRRARRVSFRGPLPPCHEFEFGKGNVGTAAMNGLRKVVPDVSTDPVYSKCFAATRSEIILPIFAPEDDRRVVGVMDVESDKPGFFQAEDETVLSQVCAQLASWLL